MRPCNPNTLAGVLTIAGLLAGGCYAMGTFVHSGAWIAVGLLVVAVAVLFFVFFWLIPRLFGGRGSESVENGGAPANLFGKIRARATLWWHSEGGIELNASVSTGGEDADEEGSAEGDGSDEV
jgi:hypothetical protein